MYLYSRFTVPSLSKLTAMHPWVNGIQICTNEGKCPFLSENNHEMLKKIYEFQNHWTNFNQTWHKASLSKGD